MIFLSKETIQNNEFISSYYHFNERLKQRYQLQVTIDEYKDLCRVQFKSFIKQSKNKNIGFIPIKGVNVIVVKERKGKRRLITAMPANKKYKK